MRKFDMARKFSICVLLFGDYPELAQRCLGSLGAALVHGASYVEDVRIGLNAVCPKTRGFVDEWAQEQWEAHHFRVVLYIPEKNVLKYPLMRRMFYDEHLPLAELVMWFDDDSYLDCQPHWWQDIRNQMAHCDMLGQCNWRIQAQGNQRQWIKTQPWYDAAVGPPLARLRGKQAFHFCQGAWWVIYRGALYHLDWPIKELRHNGGDSMLGEALRHQRLTMSHFDKGIHINADDKGKHSGAPRRGHHEPVIGKHYKPGQPIDLSHHDFEVQRLVIGRSVISNPVGKIINLW